LQLLRDDFAELLVVELDGAAEVEPLLDLLGVGVGEVAVEDVGDGGADDLADDGVGALHLAFVLELDLAGDAGERGVDVADPRTTRFRRGAKPGVRRWRRRAPWC
jgi:hypothetical protein